jgi:hypothetical protein
LIASMATVARVLAAQSPDGEAVVPVGAAWRAWEAAAALPGDAGAVERRAAGLVLAAAVIRWLASDGARRRRVSSYAADLVELGARARALAIVSGEKAGS